MTSLGWIVTHIKFEADLDLHMTQTLDDVLILVIGVLGHQASGDVFQLRQVAIRDAFESDKRISLGTDTCRVARTERWLSCPIARHEGPR